MNLIKKRIDFFNKHIDMFVYDYEFYKNNTNNLGYDIISKDIIQDNCWEPFQTEITKEILKDGNHIFIDIGHHLGYYSLLASVFNNQVYSFDCNHEYIDIFSKSIEINNITNIKTINKMVNTNFNLNNFIDKNKFIKLIKCDIEGNEIEFIDSIFERLNSRTIEYLILEISPKFRNNYPEYVLKIKNKGYRIYDIGLSPPRKLNSNFKLSDLSKYIIEYNTLDDMTKYINNLPSKQTNFLFELID